MNLADVNVLDRRVWHTRDDLTPMEFELLPPSARNRGLMLHTPQAT